METGGDVRAPIILGRPFLSTAKAIIYADSAKIRFMIKDRKEKFTFKNHILHSPSHPQMVYLPEDATVSKKRNNRRGKNRARQPRKESVKMINTLRSEYDHLLTSPFLTKKEDLGISTIKCMLAYINAHRIIRKRMDTDCRCFK